MIYTELGYGRLLTKSQYKSNPNELTEDESSQAVPVLSGTSINGGITRSPDGRMEINYNTGTIIISDGICPRILIGFQEDGFDEN